MGHAIFLVLWWFPTCYVAVLLVEWALRRAQMVMSKRRQLCQTHNKILTGLGTNLHLGWVPNSLRRDVSHKWYKMNWICIQVYDHGVKMESKSRMGVRYAQTRQLQGSRPLFEKVLDKLYWFWGFIFKSNIWLYSCLFDCFWSRIYYLV